MKRLKSKTLWVSVASLVTMILNDTVGVTPEQTEPYVNIILTIGVAAGIIVNPSNNEAERKKGDK